MGFSPGLCFFVEAFDIGLQLLPVDAPHAAPADLDRGKFARPDEGVHLRNAHAEVCGDVLEGQETRLDLGTRLLCRRLAWHRKRIPKDRDGYMDLTVFAAIW